MTIWGADTVKMREYVYTLLDLRNAAALLDIGCGDGYDLHRIGQMAGKEMRLMGIDASAEAIERAVSCTGEDSRYSFEVANLDGSLPYEAEAFDIVYSMNYLECIADKDDIIKDVHRVLRPGGQVVCAHFDWDSQIINGMDKQLMRQIIHAFSDWKQPWMKDCDPWMGRRLWGTFHRSGLFEGTMRSYVLTNTDYEPDYYGFRRIKDMEALVRHGMIPQHDYDRFIDEIRSLAKAGEYFYSITMYVYAGKKGMRLIDGQSI